MKVVIEETGLNDCLLIQPEIYRDGRGYFTELYREDTYLDSGLSIGPMVQWNESRSAQHVLRGLHFQWNPPMGKLMRVAAGVAFLVAVDIRHGSPTLGRWYGRVMNAEEDPVLLWAPAGFARGFCVLSESAVIQYLTTGTYTQTKDESGIRWNDPDIGIDWPVDQSLILSNEGKITEKDRSARYLREWLATKESQFFRYYPI